MLGEWNQYIEIGWTVKPAIYNLDFGLIKPILYILDPAVTSSNFNVNIYTVSLPGPRCGSFAPQR